jgi:hypothetical protein
MRTRSARDAKHHFGRLIDTVSAEPVASKKNGDLAVLVVVLNL